MKLIHVIGLILFLLFLPVAIQAQGIITTVAGTGIGNFNGDNQPASSAWVAGPDEVAFDAAGNLYIADTNNMLIRKVVPGSDGVINGGSDEIITTVAGNGEFGFNGDDQPATSASLAFPQGVAFDVVGNLYIADGLNGRVRKVDAVTGIITTVAGTGGSGFNGDDQPATSAWLWCPFGVAFDADGNLYIADEINHRMRKVVPGADGVINGGSEEIITTVAGTGDAGFNGDDQPATSAWLNSPSGLAFDGDGNLHITDSNNNRIRKVSFNNPPLAEAGPDQVVIVGESVQFDGTGSSDPDGAIVSYNWEFGDGMTRSGAIVGHVYTSAGAFTATLTVTDDHDAVATDTAGIAVLTAVEAIESLSGVVQDLNFQQGISNSLDGKLQNALEALNAANAGDRQDASNKLMAFINAVNAQRGHQITDPQADELVALAMRILASL
jgi:sugar lactone lactonase YvrE